MMSHGAGGHGEMRHGAWRTAPISRAASVAVRSTSTSRQRSPSDRSSLKRLKGGQEITRNLDSYRPWNCCTNFLRGFWWRIMRIHLRPPVLTLRCVFQIQGLQLPYATCTFLSGTLRNGNLLDSPSILF